MHAITFILKQAHLKNVSYGRKVVFEDMPAMTPARFDLLWQLRRATYEPGWKGTDGALLQSTLWKDLGLHRSTVAKMLKRLEEMDWIWRVKAAGNERTRTVGLTKKGLKMIEAAMQRAFGDGIMKEKYEELYTEKPVPRDPPCLALRRMRPGPLDLHGPDPVLQWRAAKEALREAIEEPKDVLDTMDDLYMRIRRVARFFGDRSTVWYHLGGGLPDV